MPEIRPRWYTVRLNGIAEGNYLLTGANVPSASKAYDADSYIARATQNGHDALKEGIAVSRNLFMAN